MLVVSGLLREGGGVAGRQQAPAGNHRHVCAGHSGETLGTYEVTSCLSEGRSVHLPDVFLPLPVRVGGSFLQSVATRSTASPGVTGL